MRTCKHLYQQGLTLVELMVAMAIGMILMLGATGVLISNQQTFRTSENLAGIQENGRIALEMLAGEIRQTGGNPCGTLAIANVLTPAGNPNLGTSWATPLQGYDDNTAFAAVAFGAGESQRVAGTDAIQLTSGATGLAISNHDVNNASFQVNSADHGLEQGDFVLACGSENSAVFQISNNPLNNTTIEHKTGVGAPGNCTSGLGLPVKCGDPLPSLKNFNGGMLVTSISGFWYIGNNDRGGTSLFRRDTTSGALTEMVDNIADLQIDYLLRNRNTLQPGMNYVAASTIADWSHLANDQVIAARITFTLCSRNTVPDAAANLRCPAGTLERRAFSVVQLRSRETL